MYRDPRTAHARRFASLHVRDRRQGASGAHARAGTCCPGRRGAPLVGAAGRPPSGLARGLAQGLECAAPRGERGRPPDPAPAPTGAGGPGLGPLGPALARRSGLAGLAPRRVCYPRRDRRRPRRGSRRLRTRAAPGLRRGTRGVGPRGDAARARVRSPETLGAQGGTPAATRWLRLLLPSNGPLTRGRGRSAAPTSLLAYGVGCGWPPSLGPRRRCDSHANASRRRLGRALSSL